MKEQGLRRQPPLLPSPPQPSSTITKNTHPSSSSQTSTLTSSLITSNLTMIKSPPGPLQQTGQMAGLGNTGLGGYGMRPNLPQQSLGTVNSWVTSPTQPQSWSSSMPQHQPQHQAMPLNLGAFDSLLLSQPRPPSMNQMASNFKSPTMMAPIRPMTMAPTPMPAPVRSLTSSDINDLLSWDSFFKKPLICNFL